MLGFPCSSLLFSSSPVVEGMRGKEGGEKKEGEEGRRRGEEKRERKKREGEGRGEESVGKWRGKKGGRERKEGKWKKRGVPEGTRTLAHITIVSGLHYDRSPSWQSDLSSTNAAGFCSFS